MLDANKKTRAINAFKRQAIVKPRDLYARYGPRVNPKAIYGSNGHDSGQIVPSGSAVIEHMIAGQQALRDALSDKSESSQ